MIAFTIIKRVDSETMWVVSVVFYTLALLLTIWGIRYHINIFRYSYYTQLSLTLAVFMPLSIIFLLPADYVAHNTSKELLWFSLPDDIVLYLWKSNYWITFILTWLIIPIIQEFYKSGCYNKFDKLRDAFKRNLKFQLAILAVSIIGVLYLLFEAGLSFNHIKLMIIALSHIYALVLALWLMAHGLISIPRNYWLAGNHVNHLNHLYLKVPNSVDNLEDTKISFKEEVLQVLVITKNFTSSSPEDFKFRDWILDLYGKIPDDFKEQMERQYLENSHNSITRDQLTFSFMTKLTANFNLNLYKLIAYESEFQTLVTNITQLEDIIAAKSNTDLQQRNKLSYRIVTSSSSLINDKTRYTVQVYITPVLSRLFSLVLFTASIIIIQSEFFHSTRLSLINALIYSTGLHKNVSLQFIISAISLSYMLFASLDSLTHLKIFNMYHLVRHRSDIVSACFYTTYIARLTIPLSYNFITLFYSRESIFEQWFGKSIHLTGLFNLMNNWIPRFAFIPVVLTIFNVYDKLKKRLGFNSDLYDSWALFDVDDGENNTNINESDSSVRNKRKDLIIVEAKRIINREMFRRQNDQSSDNLRSFNLTNAANTNYENNRRDFHTNLVSSTRSRIDTEYHDDADDDDTQANENFFNLETPNTKNVWNSIGGAFSGFRNQVSTRFSGFQGSNNATGYRDDPADDDDEAQERLVL